jgi:hypothetical protein
MFTFSKKPQSAKEIILGSLTLYWVGFKKIWVLSLVLAVLSGIPDWVMSYLLRQGYSLKVLFTVDFFLLFLLPVLTFLVAFIMYQFYLVGTRLKKSTSEVSSIILSKLVWLSIALLVAVVVSWLGVFLFILPGIFIAVMLIFVQPLILLDDHQLIEAFKYSWFLVKNNWWHTFLILTLPLIMFYIAIPLPSLYSQTPSLFRIVLDLIRMTLVTPLFFAFILVLFYDVKARHHVAMHLPRVRKNKTKAVESTEEGVIE